MKFLYIVAMVSLTGTVVAQTTPASTKPKEKVYVWEFQSNLKDPGLVESITDEFEEQLLNAGKYKLLERRQLARLLSRRANEVTDMGNLGDNDAKLLKGQGAEAVVFGNIFSDSDSGNVRLTVTLESFDGSIEFKKSVRMKPFELRSDNARTEKFRELLGLPAEERADASHQTQPSPEKAPPASKSSSDFNTGLQDLWKNSGQQTRLQSKPIIDLLVASEWELVSRRGSDSFVVRFNADGTCDPKMPTQPSRYMTMDISIGCKYTLKGKSLGVNLELGPGMALSGYQLEQESDGVFRGAEKMGNISMGAAELRPAP